MHLVEFVSWAATYAICDFEHTPRTLKSMTNKSVHTPPPPPTKQQQQNK